MARTQPQQPSKNVAPPAPQARNEMKRLFVPRRSEDLSPDNFAFEWKQSGKGGELLLAYEGPLTGRDTVSVRYGQWREGGSPWGEPREVTLQREGPHRFVGSLNVTEGHGKLVGLVLAVRADGEVWDNGGAQPMGYYVWRLGASKLEVR